MRTGTYLHLIFIFGFHLIFIWCSFDVHLMFIWSSFDLRLIFVWSSLKSINLQDMTLGDVLWCYWGVWSYWGPKIGSFDLHLIFIWSSFDLRLIFAKVNKSSRYDYRRCSMMLLRCMKLLRTEERFIWSSFDLRLIFIWSSFSSD